MAKALSATITVSTSASLLKTTLAWLARMLLEVRPGSQSFPRRLRYDVGETDLNPIAVRSRRRNRELDTGREMMRRGF